MSQQSRHKQFLRACAEIRRLMESNHRKLDRYLALPQIKEQAATYFHLDNAEYLPQTFPEIPNDSPEFL